MPSQVKEVRQTELEAAASVDARVADQATTATHAVQIWPATEVNCLQPLSVAAWPQRLEPSMTSPAARGSVAAGGIEGSRLRCSAAEHRSDSDSDGMDVLTKRLKADL